MEIVVNKEKNTVTACGITLNIIFFDAIDLVSAGDAFEKGMEAVKSGDTEVIIYSEGVVSYLSSADFDTLINKNQGLVKAVREAYNLPMHPGVLGFIELDGARFNVHYRMSRVQRSSMIHMEGIRLYYPSEDIILVGPMGHDEMVRNRRDYIMEQVNKFF